MYISEELIDTVVCGLLSTEKSAMTEYRTTCGGDSGSDVTPEVPTAVVAPAVRSSRVGRTRSTGRRQRRRRVTGY